MIKRILLLMLLTSVANATDIILDWTTPELREDGTQIETIDRFNLYSSVNNVLQSVVEIPANSTSFQLPEVAPGNYTFQISTVELGQEGALSDPVSLQINEKIISRIGKIKVTIEAVE